MGLSIEPLRARPPGETVRGSEQVEHIRKTWRKELGAKWQSYEILCSVLIKISFSFRKAKCAKIL